MATKTVSPSEILADIKAGMDDATLREKYKLSADDLKALFQELVKKGSLRLEELYNLDAVTGEPHAMRWECPVCHTLRANELEVCPKCKVYVPKFWKVQPDKREEKEGESAGEDRSRTERPVALPWKCPACHMPQPRAYDVCPQCGVIVAKLEFKSREEGLTRSQQAADSPHQRVNLSPKGKGQLGVSTGEPQGSKASAPDRPDYEKPKQTDSTVESEQQQIERTARVRLSAYEEDKARFLREGGSGKAGDGSTQPTLNTSQRFIGTHKLYIAMASIGILVIVVVLLQLKRPDPALTESLGFASYWGQADVVDLLLAKGADINGKDEMGNTALMIASRFGQVNVVKLPLAKGADVNAKNNSSQTALMDVSYSGYVDVVELLLAKGADINARTKRSSSGDWTALIRSSNRGHVDVVKLLLAKGADVNAKDDHGRKALYWASFNGHVGVVKLLLAKGADINAKDNFGETALTVASREGHRELVYLLKMLGAR